MKRKLGRWYLCINKIVLLEKLAQWHKYNIWCSCCGTIMPCKWTTPCESPTMVKFNIIFYLAHCIQNLRKHSQIDIPIVGSPLHNETIVLMNFVYFVILANIKWELCPLPGPTVRLMSLRRCERSVCGHGQTTSKPSIHRAPSSILRNCSGNL